MKNAVANMINSALTMEEVWAKYVGTTIEKRVTLCPFHSEDTPSFRVYQHSYYCFGCGEGGDLIKFVQRYWQLDFRSAIKRIDYDFNLGIFPSGSLTRYQRQKMRREASDRKKQYEYQQNEKKAAEALYWALWDEWIRLDINRIWYAPKTEEEEIHPLFSETLQKIPYQEYLIDYLT